MFVFPQFDPVAFHIGPLAVHWYGLMYIAGFLAGWWLAIVHAKRLNFYLNKDQISDLIFYAALGVVIGGRVGYMLFYDFPNFIKQPWILFEVWHGGMAFHGGLLGVVTAVWLYSRKLNKPVMELVDFIAPLVPIGLGLGRLGNFINGELVGRVTTMPWGIIYPQYGLQPRHPSELYELFFEGIVLFLIVWIYARKPRPRMAVSGMFALCYGTFRFCLEFFRQPDPQLQFILFGWMTMGQLLSIPLIIIGILLLYFAYRQARHAKTK